MATNKTTETNVSVAAYVKAIEDKEKHDDCSKVIELMKSISGFEPKMWGASIIGFGSYHYKYESGREGDMPLVCFSPRKAAIVFYVALDAGSRETLLPKFGKHKTDKGCIHVKKLADIDMAVLKEMIKVSIKNNKQVAVGRKTV
jgi:hypothetical protein